MIFAFDKVTAQDNFEIFIPDFIQPNSSFEISIITSKTFPEAEKLEIFISPDISLIINTIQVCSQDQKFQIPLQYEFVKEYSEQFQKISIDLNDSTRFSDGEYFQLLITLKSTQANPNSLKFFGEFITGNEILGYLVNSESKINSGTDALYHLSFNYYQKFSTAGNALSLVQGSYLNVLLAYTFEKV
ncbi:MAG: hypothetical protein OQK56_02895, partial [Ignavibacteriaceae bacterium]|nr:hypothetical protein [Ignavibacteriaceae bacterium]